MTTNIIKARAKQDGLSVSRITKEVHEASLEAKDILAKAREEAAQLIEDAHERRDAILVQSEQQGHAAGLEKWNDTLAETWKRREDFLFRNEAELVKLAISIAEKIVGRTVETEPGIVLRCVREALQSVRNDRKITIRVNPDDEPVLREHTNSLKMLGNVVGNLVIAVNPSIAVGGCIVESEIGVIDAQISTQLASIERALTRRFDVSSN
jgi:type III secretion protein L